MYIFNSFYHFNSTRTEGEELKLGEFLKNARLNAGLSQNFVGKTLGFGCGQYVSNFERGSSMPPFGKIKKIAKLYSIPAKDIYKRMYVTDLSKVTAKYYNHI